MKKAMFLVSILALLPFTTPAAVALDWNEVLNGLMKLPGAQDLIQNTLNSFVSEALNTINSNSSIKNFDGAKNFVDSLMAKGGYAGQEPSTDPKVVSSVKSKMTSSDTEKVTESTDVLNITTGVITILDWLDKHPALLNQISGIVGKLTDIKVTIIRPQDTNILSFIGKALPFLGALL